MNRFAAVDRHLNPAASTGDRVFRHAGVWLLLALLAGLALRLQGLDRQGLWLDEGWSLWFATQADRRGLLMENHPPLYYALLAGFARLLGSDTALRATGTIASLASVAITYGLALRLGATRGTALLAGALLALSSVDIMVARELRMYPWMTAVYAALLYAWACYASATTVNARRGAIGGALLAGVMLAYLHATGVFLACAATVFALVLVRDWRSRAWVAATGILTAVAYLPWVWLSVLERLGVMNAGLAWRSLPSVGHVLATPIRWFIAADPLFATPLAGDRCDYASWPSLCAALRMDAGLHLAGRPALLIAIVLLGVLAALGLAALLRRQPRLVLALTAAAFGPMLLLLALTWMLSPWFDVKYLAPSIVPAAVLVAVIATNAARPRLARAIVGLLLVSMAVTQAALPSTGTWQQWREAASALREQWRPGDLVMLDAIGPGAELLASRYLRLPDDAPPMLSLRQYVPDQYRSACETTGSDCLDRLTLPPPGRADEAIWMLRTDLPLELPGSFPFSARLQSWLDQHLQIVEVHSFHGIDVVKLKRRSG